MSLSERAKSLGLLPAAEQILYGRPKKVQMASLVKSDVDGLENVEKVTNGIKHIIAYIISKDTVVLEKIQKL